MPHSGTTVQIGKGERTHATIADGASERPPAGLVSVLCATAIASCWLMWVVEDVGFDRYHLPKELTLSGAALLGLLLALRAGAPIGWDRIDLLALVAVTASGVSALRAISPPLSVRSFAVELAVTVLFLTARRIDARGRALVLVSLVVAALGVALVALAESFGLIAALSRAGRTPGATLGQRNMVAHLLALGSPCAFWLAATASRRATFGLGVLASACLPATLLLTRSRAGWLGFGAAVLVFLTVSFTRAPRGALRRWVAPGLCAATVGLMLAALVPTTLSWTTTSPYADTLSRLVDYQHGSGAGRLAQYRASLALVPDHLLLGVGPGNWMVAYPLVAPERELTQHGHGFLHTGRLPNGDWIALLVERGLLSTVCSLLLAALLCRSAAKTGYAVPCLSAMAALLVMASLDAVLQLPASSCFAALLFGLSAPRRERALAVPRPLCAALVLALTIALAWTTWGAAERVLGLWARTRPSGGFAAMEAAVAWNGADLSARFALAEAYALKGDCTRARPHLRVLERLLPYHRAPRALGCGEAE